MPTDAPAEPLDRGTYDLLRERLRGHGRELAARVEKLNAARKAVFGSVEPELVATERVATEHHCVPRDIAAVGETLLFGFNVRFGLKAERSPADVFAAYAFADGRFHPRPLDLLADAAFEKDFQEVYRFYKNARFEKFARRGPLLYMQLRTGPGEADIKTFKWADDGGGLRYVDNRSEHEVRLPPQHEFDWRRPRREDQVHGKHPHVNIADKVFVETVGGDLTIKVENSTATGEGIYAEPVDDPDQRLDDAEIRYAIVGSLVLLKIKPYQEAYSRHLVYCEKTRQAFRLDGIADACRLLPADQGIIHPSGYVLHTGDRKGFEGIPAGTKFEERIDAPNGEDFLYVFYDREEGLYVLLRYNLIAQAADPPLLCHGYTIFPGGELVCFRAVPEPQRNHALQIWKTPFAADVALPDADANSDLFKIGNREIVRGLSEVRDVLTLLDKDESFADLYSDVAKQAGDLLDSYYWIRSPATFRLDEPLEQVRSAAAAAIDEFEKVRRAQEEGRRLTAAMAKRVGEAVAAAGRKRFESVEEFTTTLAEFRTLRGETIGLRDVRHTDRATLDALEARLGEESERLAGRCVAFLDRPDALTPFTSALEDERNRLGEIATARDAKEADGRIAAVAADLELLIETVSNLPIEDATQRTRVVDAISGVFATVNALRAEVRNRRKELASVEGAAEFGSQLKLLSQAVVNALDRCDTPERCDEQLSRLLLQVEELEGRFAEFDEFAVTLAERREEVSSAFETRRLSLLEARAKRAESLAAAADRLLAGIENRSRSLDSPDAIHGYFAGDLTVGKVRDLAKELTSLGDAVRADGLLTRLKSLRDDALRQLKDRQDLFAEGPNVIRLGGFRFGVNTQPVDLAAVPRDGRLMLHLTGTRFFEPLGDADLLAARDCWDQQYVSETAAVYRGEFLAYSLFVEERDAGRLDDLAKLDDAALVAWVGGRMAPRYQEGYLKGVHDRDAAAILRAVVELHRSLGPLRTPPAARALARLFWLRGCPARTKERLGRRVAGLREFAAVWPERVDPASLRHEFERAVAAGFSFGTEEGPGKKPRGCNPSASARSDRGNRDADVHDAAAFLAEQLILGDALPASQGAVALAAAFRKALASLGATDRFRRAVEAAGTDAADGFEIARDWLDAHAADAAGPGERDEAAALLLADETAVEGVAANSSRTLTGLAGDHAVIRGGEYELDYHAFLRKLGGYVREGVPRFRRFVERKQAALAAARGELKLEELKPKVMASFVRNRLIDTAYLPLVGANLAKQIGTAGEQTRADRQGLLLLVSPPGYGKTTLMEYVANRLGLVFLKINGPAVGHSVTSLDPAAAPNLAAREELKKLALGFEMGDNVMVYVDDVQHCHPEFLQKFISLCDAQRKVEGVWRGEAKTYDFRGRKVAVVMAGNPYTESGDRFEIPDMLANRADVYNLGDVTGGHREAFELSFVENALTSNPVLSRLAGRPEDAVGIARLAEGRDPATVELAGSYAAGELAEMTAVMAKLLRVRDVILKVNAEYIRSAAQADEFRVEPAFKLQGSYRNMNRIAERTLPAMNDAELDELIRSSYRNDAQTLTTGAEANLLKLRELLGWLTPAEAARWEEIKAAYRRNQKLRGIDQSDRFGQAVAQLSLFADGLSGLRDTLAGGIDRLAARDGREAEPEVAARLDALRTTLAGLAESLAAGVERLSEPRGDAGPARLTLDAETVRLLTDRPTPSRPGVRVEGDGDGPTATPGTLTVVNKIPTTLLNVLREQFRLMETWLRPILASSQRQSDDLTALARQVEVCLADYRKLVGRVAAGADDDGG